MKKFLLALGSGALLVYLIDSGRGMSLFGRFFGSASNTATKIAGSAASVAGPAQSIINKAVPRQHDNPNPDDVTLKDRVESEVLRNPTFSRAPINFNVENGTVVIRGELTSQSEINDLISQVRSVRDVKGVESYLHLPGTPAPNKEEAIRAS